MCLRSPEPRVPDQARRPGVAVLAAGLLAVFGVGLLAGCGTSSSTAHVPGPVASAMNAHLERVRAAAGRQDRAGASSELDAFAVDVAQQKAAGHLSAADYAALETGIGRARARIGIEIAPPTPAVAVPAAATVSVPATSSSQTVSPGQPGRGTGQPGGGKGFGKLKHAGKGKGDGKGNGNGGDGGD